MSRLLLHAWRDPSDWITTESRGTKHVRGVQKCGRRGCVMVRDYHKMWTPKADVVGPARRVR